MKVVFFDILKNNYGAPVGGNKENQKLIKIMIESVRQNINGCVIVQLTDDLTPANCACDLTVRIGEPPEYLMPARMEYQYKYLHDYVEYNEHVIFIDPDVIVQHDLAHIFLDDFDVGVTWKNNFSNAPHNMPFNNGIMFIKNTEKSQEFFQRAWVMVESAPKEIKTWYGDQLAMRDIIGVTNFENRTTDFLENDGIKFKLLPCDKYNYSPKGDELYRAGLNLENCESLTRLQSKQVIHFTGGLKMGMHHYWTVLSKI